MRQPAWIQGHEAREVREVDELRTGARIGVIACCGQQESPVEIHRAADVAPYEAKHAGGNAWRASGAQHPARR